MQPFINIMILFFMLNLLFYFNMRVYNIKLKDVRIFLRMVLVGAAIIMFFITENIRFSKNLRIECIDFFNFGIKFDNYISISLYNYFEIVKIILVSGKISCYSCVYLINKKAKVKHTAATKSITPKKQTFTTFASFFKYGYISLRKNVKLSF